MADITITIKGASDDLIRELGKVDKSVDEVTRSADKMGKELDDSGRRSTGAMGNLRGAVTTLGGAFAAAKIGQFVSDSIGLGIAAQEAGNKFSAVFGPAADDLRDKLEALGDKAGIADFELNNIAGTTGNVVLGLGGTRDEASLLVDQLVPLAIDLASFNGEVGNAPAVLEAMTSALTGEREALKTYGVVIKEADVQQRALQDSGKTAASELTNLEKATATVQLIMEGAGAAVGDLDRNLDSAATQQAQLSAEWKEAQAELGTALLPAMQDLVGLLRDLVPLLGGVTSVTGDAAQGLSAIFEGLTTDKSIVDVLEFNAVMEQTEILARNSRDTVHTAGTAMATLGLHGELTAAAMEEVQDATGATNEEMKAAAERAADYAKEHDFAREAIEDLDEATGFYTGVVDRQGEAMGDAEDEAALWARTLDQDATPAQEDLEEATDDATQSLAEQRDELRKAADPVFALRDAQQKLADAQRTLTELQDDGKEGTQEYEDALFDLITASSDVKVAQGELSDSMVSGGGAIAAFRELAEAAGISEDIINDLIGQIKTYNATDLNEKTFVFRVAGGGGAVTVTKGDNVGLASGGVVMPVPGGADVTVGEGGDPEAVIPLNQQGAQFMQKALGGATNGAPINITVNGFVGSELQLAAEIDRLLTRRARTSGLGFA